MAITQAGLPYGGRTKHYIVAYDDTLGTVGLTATKVFLDNCERDYDRMSSWFGGMDPIYPIVILFVDTDAMFDTWTPGDLFKTVFIGGPRSEDPSDPHAMQHLRQAAVAEVSEIFMQAYGGDWWLDTCSYFLGFGPFGDCTRTEGSRGEGLSRFLAVQAMVADGMIDATPSSGAVLPDWLNSERPNYIDDNPPTPLIAKVNGCTTAFMYYLHYQRKYSINSIIVAGKTTWRVTYSSDSGHLITSIEPPSLRGLYRNLTGGSTDAWDSFNNLVSQYYPKRGDHYDVPGDNLFPVVDLWEIVIPAQLVPGDSAVVRIALTGPAMADFDIELVSDHLEVGFGSPFGPKGALPSVFVRPDVGKWEVLVDINVGEIPNPPVPIPVTIQARYAGKTISAAFEIASPRLVEMDLSSDTVVAGDRVMGTVWLNRQVRSGSLGIVLDTSNGNASTIPAPPDLLQMSEFSRSANFLIEATDSPVPFAPKPVTVSASCKGSGSVSATLIVKSRVVAGILSKLELLPATIKGGGTVRATVTLLEAVSVPAEVSLSAIEIGMSSIPSDDGFSDLVSLPGKVTIAAGDTRTSLDIKTVSLPPMTKRTVIICASAIVTKSVTLTITG
jgi:hypothetical protein